MEAINIKAYTADIAQIEALKAFMKALKIKFEVTKTTKSPYKEEFVAMVKQGREDLKNGKGIEITLDELKDLCK